MRTNTTTAVVAAAGACVGRSATVRKVLLI